MAHANRGFLKAEVVWSRGEWERRDYPTVMDGWVVRYNVGYDEPGAFEISASRERVSIQRADIRTQQQGAEVVDIIQRAWRQHEHLAAGWKNRPVGEL